MKKIFFIYYPANKLEQALDIEMIEHHLKARISSGKLLILALSEPMSETDLGLADRESAGALIVLDKIGTVFDGIDELSAAFAQHKEDFDDCLIFLPSRSDSRFVPVKLIKENYQIFLPGYWPEINAILEFDRAKGNVEVTRLAS